MTPSNTRLAIAAGAIIVIGAAIAITLTLHRPKPAAPPHPQAAATAPVPPPPTDCLLPGPPPVPPNGATASAADMQLGRNVIQHFVNQLEDYQACRDAQADRAAKTVPDQQKQAWIQQGDEAIDEANALKDAFSEQLKLFNARSSTHP
jgi:hypothetical protein